MCAPASPFCKKLPETDPRIFPSIMKRRARICQAKGESKERPTGKDSERMLFYLFAVYDKI
jgi:hypothetical protein